jgi:hypothetical protein
VEHRTPDGPAALSREDAIEQGRLRYSQRAWAEAYQALSTVHRGEPRHDSGVARGEPGLYFVGLHFLHAFSSTMIHGVGRDAARIARAIATRRRAAAIPEKRSRRLERDGLSRAMSTR